MKKKVRKNRSKVNAKSTSFKLNIIKSYAFVVVFI